MPKTSASAKAGEISREGLLSSPWPGFTVPRYTQVPDEVFDVLMPILTEAEFKCLCYICRRTFGFRKEADAISLSQMSAGIRTREGKVVDRGTGLSRASVKNALSFLVKAGIVHVRKRMSEEGEYETNIYSLRILPPDNPGASHNPTPSNPPPVGYNLAHPGSKSSQVVGQIVADPGLKSSGRVGQNLPPQQIDKDTVNNNTTAPVVVSLAKTKTALRKSLADLGVSPVVAGRLLTNHGTEAIARVLEYALYKLGHGWKPTESLPAWIVSAITQGWEVPSWFRTADETKADSAAQTQAEQERHRRLDEDRKQEEAEMMKQRARTLRSLQVTKGTALLWTKVNQWLQEKNLWRPALTTAMLSRVGTRRALVLCGYPFSLEMVRQSADAIRQALAALTGKDVNVEVRLEDRLFSTK